MDFLHEPTAHHQRILLVQLNNRTTKIKMGKSENRRKENQNANGENQASETFESSEPYVQKRKRSESGQSDTEDKEGESRSRTPSGTLIMNAVKDIRSFFSAGQKISANQSCRTVTRNHTKVKKNSQQSGKSRSRAVSGQVRQKLLSKSKQLSKKARKQLSENPNKTQTGEESSIFFDTSMEEDGEYLTPDSATNSELSDDEQQENTLIKHIAENMKEATLSDIEQSIQSHIQRLSLQKRNKKPAASNSKINVNSAKEENDEDNPTVIPITSVLQMFQQIQTEVKAAAQTKQTLEKQELCKIKEDLVKEVNSAFESGLQKNEEVSNLKAELNHWKHKSEVLTDTVQRLHLDVQDLTQRIDNVELNNTKRTVSVSGLNILSQKGDNWQQLNQLLHEYLGLDIEIEDFYTLGSSFIVTLTTMEAKRKLMKYKYLLKNLKEKVYINEYLPPAIQEKRRRERDIVNLITAQGRESQISYGKAGLTVAGIPYKKPVQPPSPKELVNIDLDDLNRILKIKLRKDSQVIQDNSVFSAYTAPAQSHKAIREMYYKMKMIQPEARHIICAYSIQHPDIQYAQDYHDDGEPGAGRAVLNILTQNKITDRVIFVCRKYGGIRMGADRFQCYADAARGALLTHNFKLIEHPPKNPAKPKPADDIPVSQQQQSHPTTHSKQTRHPNYPSSSQRSTRNTGFTRFRTGPSRRGLIRGRSDTRAIRGRQTTTQNEAKYSYQDYKVKGQLFPSPRAQKEKNFEFAPPKYVNQYDRTMEQD